MPDLIIDAHTVVTMDAGRRVLQDARRVFARWAAA